MGRQRNSSKAARSARADWQFRLEFSDLHDAALAWQDVGDLTRLNAALDTVEKDERLHGYPAVESGAPRGERARVLAARLATASKIVTRLDRLKAMAEATRADVRAELSATLSEPNEIAGYQRLFMERLEAAGIGQTDLHPASRGLAEATAEGIRQYNVGRRQSGGQAAREDYADLIPLASWAELPRQFAGIELIDVAPDDESGFERCALPPFTDIAKFDADGSRPEAKESRRATLVAWSVIIEEWARQHQRTLTPMDRAIWAMLLAHHLNNDTSNVSNLHGLELDSPWTPERAVRIVVLPPPGA